jgi:CheY-like chemotaxis protein
MRDALDARVRPLDRRHAQPRRVGLQVRKDPRRHLSGTTSRSRADALGRGGLLSAAGGCRQTGIVNTPHSSALATVPPAYFLLRAGRCRWCGLVKLVLVVDDDPDIRNIVGQVLMGAGYAVLTAAHGAEALALMRKQMPDGVVLDLGMPVMDGKSFLRVCRADPTFADVPVALFTTTHDAALRYALDVQAYIPKPFDLDEVVREVGYLVDRLPTSSVR